ncbi:MAG: SRPBCC domain-containing protein [Flavitalea sp.]
MQQSFSKTILVDQSPSEVFNKLKNVRNWWTGIHGETITGESDILSEEFSFNAGGGMHYSKHKLIEFEQDKSIAWQITDSKLDFLKDKSEWIGTTIRFDISREGDKTKVVFTHVGLVPEFECFENCTTAWSAYLKNWETAMAQ